MNADTDVPRAAPAFLRLPHFRYIFCARSRALTSLQATPQFFLLRNKDLLDAWILRFFLPDNKT
jgi:hypothetical protein